MSASVPGTRSPLRVIWRRKSALIGGIVVLLIMVIALLAPIASPDDPNVQHLTSRFLPPGSRQHIMGTDNFGRDILSRMIFGARVSLLVGLAAVAMASSLGIIAGVSAGYFGGVVDMLVMRVADVLMAFPLVLVAIAIVSVLGPGLSNLMVAVGISSVPPFIRLVRAEVIALRSREYVEAARALGAGHWRVMIFHILRNAWAPIIVLSTMRISTVILTEASLSFLGLGVSPPTPTWGSMISEGTKYLETAPWLSTVPGVVILITVLSFNLLGDGVRDALDPRLRGEV